MQSAGNDFVVVDNRRLRSKVGARQAGRLLHRQLGVGGDQLLVLDRARSNRHDVSLKIYNPDGSEAEMCGNGVLCVALHLAPSARNGQGITMETKGGLIRAGLSPRIEVDMGKPVLEGRKIPVRATGRVIEKLLRADGRTFKTTCVSMGNPHGVIFLKGLEKFPLAHYGPLLENHPFFPKRANIEFVEVEASGQEARVRVWERGAGPTLSCGTGACATLVAGALTGRLRRNARLHFPGGTLGVRWGADDHIYLSSRSMGAVFQGGLSHV
jgi:diaminopimelate epimerase